MLGLTGVSLAAFILVVMAINLVAFVIVERIRCKRIRKEVEKYLGPR